MAAYLVSDYSKGGGRCKTFLSGDLGMVEKGEWKIENGGGEGIVES
jgi:hypothetical protein